MRRIISAYVIFFFLVSSTFDHLIAGDKKPLLFVHYMAWFQAPPYNSIWGFHWTMKNMNPNTFDQLGHRVIASHYYPLTGPYDSQDSDILEYQVLLMKISGIDGVLVDWYGDEVFYDYGIVNQGTNAIFNQIKKAKLNFGIVYEDQTITHMISGGHISSASDITFGQKAINYLQTKWFTSDTYIKTNGRPLLLNFGPQYFKKSSDWTSLFSSVNPPPLLFTEDNILSPVGMGAFPWPPMWKSNSGGILTQSALNDYLNAFYLKSAGWSYKMGGAFPGFYDFYKEGNNGTSFGYLDSQNGSTFQSTLQQAMTGGSDMIQLITWNDYGEGTNIEPTVEYGYSYLEAVQNFKISSVDPAFGFIKADLQLPLRIYQLRKSHSNDPAYNKILDRTFDLIIGGEAGKAKVVVDSLLGITSVTDRTDIPNNFYLSQNYPNPFNPATLISYKMPSSSNVSLKVFDLLGREVATLVNEPKSAGNYEIKFDGSNLSSGVYLYQLKAGSYIETKKLILMK